MPAIETEVADRAAVNAAAFAFEFRDDLHGAHLRRAGKGASGERRTEEVKRVLLGGELTFDLRDDVHHVRVAFDDRVVGHLDGAGDADAAEVIAGEVDEHQVLGAFLRIGEQFDLELAVGGFVGAAGAGAGDRADLAEAAREADVYFG